MQRGGAWYNPLSWFNNSTPSQPQPAAVEQGQSTNSILGTFSNLTNKTEEALKNAGQSLGNLTNNTKNAFSGMMGQQKRTSRQTNNQFASSSQMPSSQMPSSQMPSSQMPPSQMPSSQMPSSQMPSSQMGGMPPNLNLTYPSWAGDLNVAKPTYWVNDYNQHIMGGRRRRSNKHKRNKRRKTNKRHKRC